MIVNFLGLDDKIHKINCEDEESVKEICEKIRLYLEKLYIFTPKVKILKRNKNIFEMLKSDKTINYYNIKENEILCYITKNKSI